jgi:hypothetical protein
VKCSVLRNSTGVSEFYQLLITELTTSTGVMHMLSLKKIGHLVSGIESGRLGTLVVNRVPEKYFFLLSPERMVEWLREEGGTSFKLLRLSCVFRCSQAPI